MRRLFPGLAAVCTVFAAASTAGAQVIRVGSYHHIAGQFSSIQNAVNHAKPGDWVLVGPGDYKTTGSEEPPGQTGFPSAVLITTPQGYLRGMNRNTVIVDGTKPGTPACSSAASDQNYGPNGSGGAAGLNGIMVWKADNVWVQNLTACNFLGGSDGDGATGNEIWVQRWRRQRSGRRSGLPGHVPERHQHVLQRRDHSRAVRDLLEQLERRHLGSGLRVELQRLGVLYRRLPAGLRSDHERCLV